MRKRQKAAQHPDYFTLMPVGLLCYVLNGLGVVDQARVWACNRALGRTLHTPTAWRMLLAPWPDPASVGVLRRVPWAHLCAQVPGLRAVCSRLGEEHRTWEDVRREVSWHLNLSSTAT